MNNLKPLKTAKDGLFSQNISMEKSIILLENTTMMDSTNSLSTIRAKQRRRTQPCQDMKSSIYAQNVMYPGHNFLAKKLKRILSNYLLKSFVKIKSYRKRILNLNLINTKAKRFISWTFVTLKTYVHFHKDQQIYRAIQRNKKPNLIYLSVKRIVTKNQKIFLLKLVNQVKRQKYIRVFAMKLENITKNSLKMFFKKIFFRKMQNISYLTTQKIEGARMVTRIIPKAIQDTKTMILQKMMLKIKIQNYQTTFKTKKEASSKISQNSVNKTKLLVYQREQIQKIKASLDDFSSYQTKARYQMRRELNVNRNKIKQQEKKSKTTISDLIKQTNQFQQQLNQLTVLNQKRLARIKSPINQKTVIQLYLLVWQEQANKVGQIKLRRQIRQKSEVYRSQLDKLNEYHTYQNQNLRQEVFQYQKIEVFKSRWPQEQLILEQNKILKQIIQCIIFRSLDNKCYEARIKKLRN